ncbi:hypothetical protein [Cryptosporangium phraense]|uniref:Uncharacterized protein n=1 Tax=Cryptosporangium phraense TaxID=2593070 RepID=A0A545AMZ2_9ACTN|nr:hypothetical protein [Cryptosporangium phraense]TQS42698.1 hypothetical protein FL583_23740 [Cryptosporangium phraense]
MTTTPPAREAPLPGADERRAALLRELQRAPAVRRTGRLLPPFLAAGAVAATVAAVVLGAVVLEPRTDGRPTTTAAPARAPSPTRPALRDDSLNGLLARVDKAVKSYRAPNWSQPDSDYVYTKARVRTAGGALATREQWFPADGHGTTSIRIDGGPMSEEPSGVTGNLILSTLKTAAEQPTYSKIDPYAGRSGPLDLLEAIRHATKNDKGDPEGNVFARVRRLLQVAGVAEPPTAAWLYHAAALVPGAGFDPDVVDVTGKHVAAITYGRQMIAFDPASGALRYEGVLPAGGKPDAISLGGIVDKVGATTIRKATPPPSPSEVPEVSQGKPSWDPAADIRDVDVRNLKFEVPIDVSRAPVVDAGLDSGSGGPVADFRDGRVTLTERGKKLELTIGKPVYLTPNQAQLDGVWPTTGPKYEDAAKKPGADCAVVTIAITSSLPDVQYAVILFSGAPGPLFPGPQSIVLIVRNGPGPVVTTDGDTLSIAEHPGATPQKYTRSGLGFAPAK